MTRINQHQVIQMVGDDRIVMFDDDNLTEVSMLIEVAKQVVDALEPRSLFFDEFTIGPEESTANHYFGYEFPAVAQAINYFYDVMLLPPGMEAHAFTPEPGESFDDFMKRAGLL